LYKHDTIRKRNSNNLWCELQTDELRTESKVADNTKIKENNSLKGLMEVITLCASKKHSAFAKKTATDEIGIVE
jgi:hypothetical protein